MEEMEIIFSSEKIPLQFGINKRIRTKMQLARQDFSLFVENFKF